MSGGNNILARLQKRVPEDFNALVRAVAEHHVIDTQPKFLCDAGTQMIPAAIRIEMSFKQGLLHSFDGNRRGAKRVLVRGELYDLTRLQPDFPRHLLDRLASDVTFQSVEPLVR